MEAELAALKEQMLQYTKAADHVSKDVEEVTGRMSKAQAVKTDGLTATHSQELAALRAELDKAENRCKEQLELSLKGAEEARRIAEAKGSKEAAEALESQKRLHAQNIKLLEDSLDEEKRKGVDAVSRFEQMEAELSAIKDLLSEEQRKSARLAQDVRMQQESAATELNEALTIKDKEMSDLEHEMQALQITHSRELEELERAAAAKESLLEAEIDLLRSKKQTLETNTNSTSARNDELLQSKDREISHQSQVIEDLQNKIQQLHEVKEREIEEVKSCLIAEHEQMMSKARREHETALSTLRNATREGAEETALLHQQNEARLEEEHKLALEKLQWELAEMRTLKVGLENSMEATTIATTAKAKKYQDRVEKTEKKLEETRFAETKANEALDAIRADIDRLQSEKDQAKAEILSTQEALEAASREVTSLQKTLETLGNVSSDSDKQNADAIQKMKEEADATSRLLKQKITEHDSALEIHVQQLESIRASHSKEIAGLEKKNREALQTSQKTHDELLAEYEKARKEHPSAINALKAEHADALEKQIKIHERLKRAHAEELTKIESQIRESDDLRKQREKDVGSFQKKFEDTLAAQKTHEAALADLRSQLDKQSEVLVATRHQLQEARASRSEEEYKKVREAEMEVRELRRLIADAQAKAVQDKEAIDKLTAEVEEASDVSPNVAEAERLREKLTELTEQHAAEISKLQEAASLGNDQGEEQRKQDTEIRDRLMDELEKLKADLSIKEEKIEEQQQALEAHNQKAEELGEHLTASRTLLERLQSDLQKALAELEVFRVEAQNSKTSTEEMNEADTAATNQMLEALEAAADAERELNATLKERLRQAEMAAEKHATRVREVESALKVTTAELVEMRTERRGGSDYSGSPAPKAVLRSSLWPVPDVGDSGERKTAMVGEELGSSIMGRVGCPFTFTS